VFLDAIDKALLGGELGESARRAMELLLRYGEVLGAARFIDIASAHVDSCLYHGPSGLDFVRYLEEGGGRVRVRTTLNVTAFDLDRPGLSRVPADAVRIQKEMVEAYLKLGCLPTMTCAPYQHVIRPRPGQHVAWAESNAVVFVNSVLGARGDRYGDFTDISAALTGRVPEAGLHLEENRRASLVLDLPSLAATRLERDLYFAALGYRLGQLAGARVAALVGGPEDVSEDELKAVGAAAASSGGVALFHWVGVTPDAPTLGDALGGDGRAVETRRVGAADLAGAAGQLCNVEPGEPVAALCLGTPHFSRAEFEDLAARIAGRTAAPGVSVLVSTSRAIAREVEDGPLGSRLGAFGVTLVRDTCTYLVPSAIDAAGVLVTPSAKYAHYAPGNTGRRTALMSLDRCLRCAVAGEVVP
jgi:predicted aconitase